MTLHFVCQFKKLDEKALDKLENLKDEVFELIACNYSGYLCSIFICFPLSEGPICVATWTVMIGECLSF